MKVEIENYRGWEITFDTDREEFYCMSNEWDTDKTKKSYSSAKKYIDDYIKENTEFKPFYIERIPYAFNDFTKKSVIGVRKDKKFNVQNEDGTIQPLSIYDEEHWILHNPENKKHFNKINELNKELEGIREKIKTEISYVKKITVKQYKETLGL